MFFFINKLYIIKIKVINKIHNNINKSSSFNKKLSVGLYPINVTFVTNGILFLINPMYEKVFKYKSDSLNKTISII